MRKAGEKPKAGVIEPIQVGVFLSGSSPIQVDNRTWRFGLAQTESGQQAVFACACDARVLFVQAVVSSLGRALGLPVPPCYVLLANQETFPEWNQTGSFMIFACQAGPHPTMAAFARRLAEAADILTHGKRETINRLIVLDEWASNGARDQTALLVDTASGMQFIDHHPSLAITEDPADQMRNWVFEVAHTEMTELDARRLRNEMKDSAGKVFDLELGLLADQAAGFGSAKELEAWLQMLDFLSQRRHLLEELFCQRLGIPEKQLALAP
jgi:hypothetical protein